MFYGRYSILSLFFVTLLKNKLSLAGIYTYPLLQKRCILLDFFSTTRSRQKTAYIRALCHELTDRKTIWKERPIETIYLGGGTPSIG